MSFDYLLEDFGASHKFNTKIIIWDENSPENSQIRIYFYNQKLTYSLWLRSLKKLLTISVFNSDLWHMTCVFVVISQLLHNYCIALIIFACTLLNVN